LYLLSESVDRFHNTVFTPIVTKHDASALSEQGGYDLKNDTVHLPRREASIGGILALGHRAIHYAAGKRPTHSAHGRLPVVAAKVLGVTRSVPGAYLSTSVP